MKISDVRSYNLYAKVQEPFEWPDGTAFARTAGLVRIDTDAGISGWGPAEEGWTPSLNRVVQETLVGRSPQEIWPLFQTLRRRRLPLNVCGAIDVALWDIRGKMLGQPIHQLLGGALRTQIPAYATGGYYLLPDDSIDWLRERVQQSVDRGFRAYKMKVAARDLDQDLRRVDAVLDVLGPDRWLAADATTAYTRPQALQMGRELEQRNLLWYEDPLRADDVDGYAWLTDQLRLPITAHYAANDANLLALFLRRRAADQVQPSLEAVGGYTLAQQMIGMAGLHHVSYDPSCWSTHLHIAATLHILAVIPSPSARLRDIPPMLEFDTSDNPLRDDTILTETIEIDADGTVAVPDGPGLGIAIDEEKLAKYAITHVT